MRRLLLTLMTLFLLATLWPGRAVEAAQGDNPSTQEPDSGAVLCPPAVYLASQDDCLPLGAAQFLTDMAALGITFPIQPLPVYAPSPDLNYIPFSYFKVTEEGLSLYATLDAAMADQPSGQVIRPGFLYVSYEQRVKNDQGVFYYLRSGAWIRGDG